MKKMSKEEQFDTMVHLLKALQTNDELGIHIGYTKLSGQGHSNEEIVEMMEDFLSVNESKEDAQ